MGRRSGRTTLDRAQIAGAALAVVDREGLDGLTIRALGRELDVEGPAVYYHVRNKDEILDLVVDALVADIDIPVDAAAASWRGLLRAALQAYRDAALAHPRAAPLLLNGPRRGGTADGLAVIVDRLMTEAGFTPAQTATVLASLLGFVDGHLLHDIAGTTGGAVASQAVHDHAVTALLDAAERLLPHR